MKKTLLFVFLGAMFALQGRAQVAVDAANFPDPVFRQYVSDNVDTDHDGSLSTAECNAVTSLGANTDAYTQMYSTGEHTEMGAQREKAGCGKTQR
ncbi:MAG: hypothetical protein J6I60_02220 [Bacteroidaceae bacterium]|nr:hypothetical protein [Bacteroidaceae bacterium]